jgi:8-oxo-dGTP pyrophosphatase MutT (NUDIX family)
VRQRVLAYVTRERHGRTELLVFEHRDHPDAGTQVPAGGVGPGETPQEAVLRELDEEAGLARARVVRELPVLGDWIADSVYESARAFELQLDEHAPDTWEHEVHGDGEDAGLVFVYRWIDTEVGVTLWDGDPTYTQLR